MILRVALSLCAVGLLFYFFVTARKRPAQKIGISLTFVGILGGALFPDASTWVANLVGVGRGVDLVFYLSIMVLLFLTFSLYLNQRELKEQTTLLARHAALGRVRTVEGDSPVFVVVPVYNEAEVIAEVIGRLCDAGHQVVAIDDGSADGSHAALLKTGAHVVQHPVNLGQGAALQTGFDYALSQGAEVVITFDGDGQHQVEDIPTLVQALDDQQVDVALGSRFLGTTEGMPASRRALLKGAVVFTRYLSGARLTDAHNGFRAFRAEALSRLRISQNRMAHASEILHKLVSLKLRYVEVPVTIKYTEHSMAKGQSGLGAINIVFDLLIKRLFG